MERILPDHGAMMERTLPDHGAMTESTFPDRLSQSKGRLWSFWAAEHCTVAGILLAVHGAYIGRRESYLLPVWQDCCCYWWRRNQFQAEKWHSILNVERHRLMGSFFMHIMCHSDLGCTSKKNCSGGTQPALTCHLYIVWEHNTWYSWEWTCGLGTFLSGVPCHAICLSVPGFHWKAARAAARGKGSRSYKWSEKEMRANTMHSVFPSCQLLGSFETLLLCFVSAQGSEIRCPDLTFCENLLCSRDCSVLVLQCASGSRRTWKPNSQHWCHLTVEWWLHVPMLLL